MSRAGQSTFYGLWAVLLWATIATAFKIALRGLDVFQTVLIASFVAAAALVMILIVRGRWGLLLNQGRSGWVRSAITGLVVPLAYYLVLLAAYNRLSAQEAMTLNYLWPLILSVMAAFFLRQPLSIMTLLGLALGLLGVTVIATHGHPLNLSFSSPTGVALALGSTVIWAAFWISSLKDSRDEGVKLATNFLFGTLYAGVAWALFSRALPQATASTAAAVYIGFFEMGFTFLLWLTALRSAPRVAVITNLAFLTPFLSLVVIRVVLGEPLHASSLAGLVLIVSGIILSTVKWKQGLNG